MADIPSAPRPYRSTVRLALVAEAREAVTIIREAAAWAAARGTEVWAAHEIRDAAFEEAACRAELVIGYAGAAPVATMLLQTEDPVYWPQEAPACALYLHKVAIRRAFAGQGWLDRLIGFAVQVATQKDIARLRLDTILRPKLQSLYERHGFRRLAEEPLLIGGRQMIRMERILSSRVGGDR